MMNANSTHILRQKNADNLDGAIPPLYHGTTRKQWASNPSGASFLHLSSSREDAMNYAYEAAAFEEGNGDLDYEAVIVAFSPRAIRTLLEAGLQLEADSGWVEGLAHDAKVKGVAFAEPTWQESLSACNGVAISGFADSYKIGLPVLKADGADNVEEKMAGTTTCQPDDIDCAANYSIAINVETASTIYVLRDRLQRAFDDGVSGCCVIDADDAGVSIVFTRSVRQHYDRLLARIKAGESVSSAVRSLLADDLAAKQTEPDSLTAVIMSLRDQANGTVTELSEIQEDVGSKQDEIGLMVSEPENQIGKSLVEASIMRSINPAPSGLVEVNQFSGIPVAVEDLAKAKALASALEALSSSQVQLIAKNLAFDVLKCIVTELLHGSCRVSEEAVEFAMEAVQTDHDRLMQYRNCVPVASAPDTTSFNGNLPF